jgi:hypothetical protein
MAKQHDLVRMLEWLGRGKGVEVQRDEDGVFIDVGTGVSFNLNPTTLEVKRRDRRMFEETLRNARRKG